MGSPGHGPEGQFGGPAASCPASEKEGSVVCLQQSRELHLSWPGDWGLGGSLFLINSVSPNYFPVQNKLRGGFVLPVRVSRCGGK